MSEYGIYIIESLRSNDFFDGENLSEVLAACKIKFYYKEVLTKDELIKEIANFEKSNFRYYRSA